MIGVCTTCFAGKILIGSPCPAVSTSQTPESRAQSPIHCSCLYASVERRPTWESKAASTRSNYAARDERYTDGAGSRYRNGSLDSYRRCDARGAPDGHWRQGSRCSSPQQVCIRPYHSPHAGTLRELHAPSNDCGAPV